MGANTTDSRKETVFCLELEVFAHVLRSGDGRFRQPTDEMSCNPAAITPHFEEKIGGDVPRMRL